MENVLKGLLLGTHGFGAYALVFGVLLVCGVGVPLPEDISLLLGGYLAFQGAVNLPVMMLVGYVGILVGDSMIYLAGRRFGAGGRAPRGAFKNLLTQEKRERVEALFARHGEKIVMLARFMPGVRALTYFTAGASRMRYWRFALFDSVAALASAPLFVYLGYRFGGQLEATVRRVRDGQVAALVAVTVIAFVYYLVHRRSRHTKHGKVTDAGSAGLAPPSSGRLE